MSWQTVRLSDIAVLDRQSIHPSEADAEACYVGLEHVDGDGTINSSQTVSSAELKSNKFLFTDQHILFGKLRPYLRKIARPRFSGVCSTDIIPIFPKGTLSRDYLFHLLRTPTFVDLATSRSSGANLPRLSPNQLAAFKVPLPSLSEQKRIAGILDAADALRAKSLEALTQFDILLQSTFLDMFGDPVTNPMGFQARSLSEFYINERDGTKCGPFGSALKKQELVESGVPVWNMGNIDPSGRVVLPFRMWITEEKYQELEAYSVIDGDVIVSRAGTVGKMCVTDIGGAASVISTNLIRVRFGPALLPIYFVSLMTYCKGRVGRLKAGPEGAFTHMSTRVLGELRFPYPPIDLQRRFADIVESVERQRTRMRAHLAELDALFASLQSRAFSGAL